MLTPGFAGELFGDGQVLDTKKYFVILPDALGAGQSAKPSDGPRAKFPRYNYDDMVLAQYRLLTEGLGIRHLRLVFGNSMGGMETWVWGVTYPAFMDALAPMASQPTEMSARNWMARRIMIETIRQDPAWNNGDYTAQPPSLRLANVFFGIATNGGTLWVSVARADAGEGEQAGGRTSGRVTALDRQRLAGRRRLIEQDIAVDHLHVGGGRSRAIRIRQRHSCLFASFPAWRKDAGHARRSPVT